jgi:formylglycine-generating enzyme required for sulfatase activity
MIATRGRLWALGLTILAGACGAGAGGDDTRTVVRDSVGIRIVENPAEDRSLGAVLVHIADLVPPDSSLDARPWGVAADPGTGRVYVADRHGARVVVFDRSGAFVESYGRAGGGPGEFRNPSAVDLDEDGVLTVWDTRRGVLSRWSPEGRFLGEETTEVPYWGPGFQAESGRLVTVTGRPEASGMGMDQRLVVAHSGGTETIHELPVRMSMLELPCIRQAAPKIFSPSITWTARGDRVYVLAFPDYRIDVYVDAALVESIRRGLEPITVTEAMAVEAVESGSTPFRTLMRLCNVGAEQLVRAVGYEERISPVQGVAVDPEGRLWVTRTENGSHPAEIDLFDRDGAYLGTFDAPGIPVGFLSASRFVSLRLDPETGETVVSLHSLGESAMGEAAGRVASAPARSAATPAPDRAEPTADGDAPLTADDRAQGDGTPAPAAATVPITDDVDPTPGFEFRDCPECPIMVVLPPGRFLMGSGDGEAEDEAPENVRYVIAWEKPQVEVQIDYVFAMGKYEVTFAEWDRCVEAGGCDHRPDDRGWGRGNRPVIHVNRSQAIRYTAWLSEKTGKKYRLPSEVEWEYAARAGTTTARYWGDEVGKGLAVCDGCGSRWDKRSTAPVGSFPPNAFGLHDMLGNVSEWVLDCWHPSHEGIPTDGSPRLDGSPYWQDGTCQRPIRRGAAWSSYAWAVRAASRAVVRLDGPWGPAGDYADGFRVVREIDAGGRSAAGSSARTSLDREGIE